MGKASATYRELRFVIEEELTQAYVFVEAGGDAPIGVQGWHHKTFARSMSVAAIVGSLGTDDPVLWPLNAPPVGR